jgi:hypothetical protein
MALRSQKTRAVVGVAVVGLSGLLRVLYLTMSKMMEMEMPAFDTREEALEWLAGLP